MNLKILLSFFATGIVSTVMEPIRIKRPVVDYDYVATCLAEGYMALKEELSKMPNHKAETEDEKVKCSCNFLRRSKDCFLEQLRDHPNVPILRYSALWEWQHLVMANAAGVCPVIPPGHLKTIGKEVLAERPDLKNLEDFKDTKPKPCVKEGMRRCLIKTETSFEAQNNTVNPNFYYTECYEEQVCDSEMFRRFLDYGKAIKAKKPAAKSDLTP